MDKATYTYEALQQKYVNFITPALEVTIGSTTYSSREIPILNLEVELNADGSAGGCSFTVDSQYKAEASKWKNDFDKSVKAGAKLAVRGGYVKMEEIFYGYIDEYSFVYNGNEGPRIEITGIDGLGYLMSCLLYTSDPEKFNRGKCLPVGSENTEETDWCYVTAAAGGMEYGFFWFPRVDDLVLLDVYKRQARCRPAR